jgi:hypothetical protein
VNTQPKNILKILQLLLRCGMVCQEELNVVLEMMPAVPDGGLGDGEERADTVTRRRDTEPLRDTVAPQSRQKTLTLELDNRG